MVDSPASSLISASVPAEVKIAAAIACVVGGCCLTSMVALSPKVESHLLTARGDRSNSEP
eukprot:CAMPEP_0180140046 /NCGR_PEP_ID=MMETSP0986-20121125/13952_1 /TAXON_ID=697907 /ORGANISM="non described non described, Strain CCMP2293" /LENGTH=59 /DNA_ID=CAMNT_0022082379 /DNA_START=17 /DNA_END=196 /DNA_ORIENTATION=+